MHFALPPRKTSQPPPFARVHARSAANARRRTLQLVSYVVLGALTLYLVIHYLSPSTPSKLFSDEVPPNPTILIVTVLDPSGMSDAYMSMIRSNRDDYARRHNYQTFYTNTSTYTHLTAPSPTSWSLVPALRHALKLHPDINYIWSLTPHALVTAPSLSLHSHILSNLSALMQKDTPVVPPDSVIHTYSHIMPNTAHLILSQDMDNLAHTSFLLKNTPGTSDTGTPDPHASFAEYLLDAWFDPLYRTYAFHLADLHALEHLIQWHPTITARLALIPQRIFNSYNFATAPRKLTDETGHTLKVTDENGVIQDAVREHDSMWSEGDLVVSFKGCLEAPTRDCELEMTAYYKRWQREVEKLDGRKADATVREPVQAFDG